MSNLDKMRDPFPENQISKLPKPTKFQTDAVKNDFKNGMRCGICGGWHHKDVIHLDYVGHAALTDRLLDVDPNWNWKPLSFDDKGQPIYDSIGGLWIELTVCGITRLGYGNAGGKKGGDAIKEVIGDALRNSAMRFGAALDLWHKGELHIEDEEKVSNLPTHATSEAIKAIKACTGIQTLESEYKKYVKGLDKVQSHFINEATNAKKLQLEVK